MITHEICKFCGGKCCTGEITGTYKKCDYLGNNGCTHPDGERNVMCNVYPYVIILDTRQPHSRRVFLDTSCPYWHLFVDLYKDIRDDDPVSLAITRQEVPI
jgi:hypothetical protein